MNCDLTAQNLNVFDRGKATTAGGLQGVNWAVRDLVDSSRRAVNEVARQPFRLLNFHTSTPDFASRCRLPLLHPRLE